MFTRNYYNGLASIYRKFGSTDLSCVDSSGTHGQLYAAQILSDTLFPSLTSDNTKSFVKLKTTSLTTSVTSSTREELSGIYLGTGSTEPTVDDYKLSGTQITTFSVLSTAFTTNVIDNVQTFEMRYVIRNTGTAEFTIGEIAYFGCVQMNNSSTYKRVLFERTVLDEPLTVPANATAEILYKWNITLPTV